MKKLFSSLLLLLTSVTGFAQFEIQLAATAGSALGIRAEPYNNPFLDISILAKGEVGYTINDWLYIGGFICGGSIDKSDLSQTYGTSRVRQYGLTPRLTILSSAGTRHNFDLSVPVSYCTQEVNWKGLIYSSQVSGEQRGRDLADFFTVGLQPSYRFYSSKSGFTYNLGLVVTHLTLIEASREVYTPETSPDNFNNSGMWLQEWNLQAVAGIGYRF